jgi:hypothetical protein
MIDKGTLADRIYDIAQKTSEDTINVMDTYLKREGYIHSREYKKGRCSLSDDYQEHTLAIMERYAQMRVERR